MRIRPVETTVLPRWWWGPLTVAACVVASIGIVAFESMIGYRPMHTGPAVLSRLFGGVMAFGAIAWWHGWFRLPRRPAHTDNPYWAGVGYGGAVVAAGAMAILIMLSPRGWTPDLLWAPWLPAVVTGEVLAVPLVGAAVWGTLVDHAARRRGPAR